MSEKVTAFRTDDGILDIEIANRKDKPAVVRINHDELEFKGVEDFDEWMRTLANARDEFTAVRAT